jgi:hypothetical protein
MKIAATDWNAYYEGVPATAKLTRTITGRRLVSLLTRYSARPTSIIEVGGANSCFFATLNRVFCPSRYTVIDTNEKGLQKFLDQHGTSPKARCVLGDILTLDTNQHGGGDLVFSAGLIEHFDPEDTKRAVSAHFELARAGGFVLVTFPTPVLIYRVARKILEWAGLWKFPDERPLEFGEVRDAITSRGDILHEEINRAIVLAQGIILARKTG